MNEKFINAFKVLDEKMRLYNLLDDEVVDDSTALYKLAGEGFKEEKLLSGRWSIIIDTRTVKLISDRLNHKTELKEYKNKLQKHIYENQLILYVDEHVKAIFNLNSYNIEFHLYHFNADILKKFVDDYGIVITKYLPSDFGTDIKTLLELDKIIKEILES